MKIRGRKSMLAIKAESVLETIRAYNLDGDSPSWLDLMIEHHLSTTSLARILRKLEFDGRLIRKPGHGNVRNEYLIIYPRGAE